MKKLILAAAIVLSMAKGFSQTETGTTGSLTWILTLSDSTLTISGNDTMPNYADGTYVPWYSFNGEIKTVIIDDGVTSIGNYAFGYYSGYNNLISVTIPNSVKTIGEYAFYGSTGLTFLIIPENVTSIGRGAFSFCHNIQTIDYNAIDCVMDNSIASMFADCDAFTLNIGNQVKSIPDNAFRRCTGLTSLIIPDNVTTIGDNAFLGVRL